MPWPCVGKPKCMVAMWYFRAAMKPRILFGILNWGLGHASRCVPLIRELELAGFDVLLASDGPAMLFLQKTFPHLQTATLPAYSIAYSTGRHQTLKIALQTPKILRAILEEQKAAAALVKAWQPVGIISDNRMGFFHPSVPSVYITHQLQFNLVAGSKLANCLHAFFYARFTEVWVPDFEAPNNLAGKLSEVYHKKIRHRYIGPQSRLFAPPPTQKKWDLLVVLSGPEPQRTLLEQLVLSQAHRYAGSICLVRGVFDGSRVPSHSTPNNVAVYNYLLEADLAQTIAASSLCLMRAGYSSLMDLAALNRGAVLVPTPGQPEQEYLATLFQKLPAFEVIHQANLNLERLPKALPAPTFPNTVAINNLFQVFK